MIVPDINLLIYAHFSGAPNHARASEWWSELTSGQERVGIPWIVAVGFLRVSTNPRAMTTPLSTGQATQTVTQWFVHPHVASLLPGKEHMRILGASLETVGVGGNLVTDAHIAALVIEHRAELHSNDSDFARFPDLRWRNPLQSQTH